MGVRLLAAEEQEIFPSGLVPWSLALPLFLVYFTITTLSLSLHISLSFRTRDIILQGCGALLLALFADLGGVDWLDGKSGGQ